VLFFEIRGVRVHMSVRRGCAQGGVLSPLLWNMPAGRSAESVEDLQLFEQGFADDVVILISGKFFNAKGNKLCTKLVW
jgi:hypothetical protein